MDELKALTPMQQRYFDQQHGRDTGERVPSVEEVEGPAPPWPRLKVGELVETVSMCVCFGGAVVGLMVVVRAAALAV